MKHIVGFSGGIDSQACARWVLNRFPAEDVILMNSNAGRNEHPFTDQFVAEYSKKVHPVIRVIPKISDIWKTEGFAETKGLDGEAELDFPTMMKIKKRPPSRTAQFCTEILKLKPSARWIRDNMAEEEYERYSGLRRDESARRKSTPFR